MSSICGCILRYILLRSFKRALHKLKLLGLRYKILITAFIGFEKKILLKREVAVRAFLFNYLSKYRYSNTSYIL